MEYAQLNEAGTEAIQIITHGNVEWDSTHFCPANALTQDEAAVFRVVPLTVTTMPAYDAITHRCFRDGCEKVGDDWQYKWMVEALDADTVAANQAVHVANIQGAIIAATQLRLDTFAQTRNYDGILSACTYATSSVPQFAGEGQYCVDARDATWATLYTIMGEVLAQTRPMPESFADVAPLLPALAWPA